MTADMDLSSRECVRATYCQHMFVAAAVVAVPALTGLRLQSDWNNKFVGLSSCNLALTASNVDQTKHWERTEEEGEKNCAIQGCSEAHVLRVDAAMLAS